MQAKIVVVSPLPLAQPGVETFIIMHIAGEIPTGYHDAWPQCPPETLVNAVLPLWTGRRQAKIEHPLRGQPLRHKGSKVLVKVDSPSLNE
jgi:hypothetical protein